MKVAAATGENNMSKYLVETSHNREDCLHVLDQFVAYGHITHFEWGCENGVCTGWAFVDGENEEHVLYSVPAFLRNKARAVKVSHFTPPQNSGVSRRSLAFQKPTIF